MNDWFEQHRNKLEKLQHQYQQLMRKSFELALKDKIASDVANEQALKIYQEIMVLRDDQESA